MSEREDLIAKVASAIVDMAPVWKHIFDDEVGAIRACDVRHAAAVAVQYFEPELQILRDNLKKKDEEIQSLKYALEAAKGI